MKYLKTTSTLLNKAEVEQAERLGMELTNVAEASVIAYYNVANIIAITEHVNNEGRIIPNTANVIFNNDNTIVVHVTPEDFIEAINSQIVKL